MSKILWVTFHTKSEDAGDIVAALADRATNLSMGYVRDQQAPLLMPRAQKRTAKITTARQSVRKTVLSDVLREILKAKAPNPVHTRDIVKVLKSHGYVGNSYSSALVRLQNIKEVKKTGSCLYQWVAA